MWFIHILRDLSDRDFTFQPYGQLIQLILTISRLLELALVLNLRRVCRDLISRRLASRRDTNEASEGSATRSVRWEQVNTSLMLPDQTSVSARKHNLIIFHFDPRVNHRITLPGKLKLRSSRLEMKTRWALELLADFYLRASDCVFAFA